MCVVALGVPVGMRTLVSFAIGAPLGRFDAVGLVSDHAGHREHNDERIALQ